MVAHRWESITLTFLTISKSFDLKKKKKVIRHMQEESKEAL